MEIESGIRFYTVFDMEAHQKPLVESNFASKSCPSSKLVLGQLVLDP